MKNTIIAIIVIVLLGVGVYFLTQKSPDATKDVDSTDVTYNADGTVKTTPQNQNPVIPVVPEVKTETVIGNSVDGNAITAYHYGTGNTELLFVGGIHGGYSWNTSLVAFEMMNYLKANPNVIPSNLKVTVIPVMNPDGLKKVTGTVGIFESADVSTSTTVQTSGRFNANDVDLSRNFDCDWKSNALWQNKAVSGGSAVFSEPESMAMKSYIEANNPLAVVVWYSSEGKVYSSSCGGGVLPETATLTSTFSKASGYPAGSNFSAYKVTGDFVSWLAKEEIPAISVLLTNHQDVEWNKNKLGMEAMFSLYGKQQ